jgi:hypothetical protein
MRVRPEQYKPEKEEYWLEWEREKEIKGRGKEEGEKIAGRIKLEFGGSGDRSTIVLAKRPPNKGVNRSARSGLCRVSFSVRRAPGYAGR